MIEKLALELIHSARQLRQYFQSHQVMVKIDHSLKQVLKKLSLIGRMVAWSVELFEFGLWFEPRGFIKGKCLDDFLIKLPLTKDISEGWWTLYVDEAFNNKGNDVTVTVEGPNNVSIKQLVKFD